MAAARAARPFDLVAYGATGFTGRLLARYLAEAAPPGVKWALGGRSRQKLEALKAELTVAVPSCKNVGIVVGDGETAHNVAESCRAVITTAGPYALYGEPLLRACVEAGTDYCDLTGEPAWAARMLSAYEERARESGAIVVMMSGFDSVPADLGTFFVARHARVAHGACVNDVKGIMHGSGGVSGGTIASGLNAMREPGAAAVAGDPLCLFPGHVPGTPPSAEELAVVAAPGDAAAPFFAPEVGRHGKWAAYFVMGAINTRVVRRTAGILATRSGPVAAALGACEFALPPLPAAAPGGLLRYSAAPFRYTEYMAVGSLTAALLVNAAFAAARLVTAVPGVPALLSRVVTQPGDGPSPETRAKSFFHYYISAVVEGRDDGAIIVGRVAGGDGGYTDTAKMIGEAGLALATQRAALPGAALGGGFLTPATAFGGALVDRLQRAGIRFEITRDDVADAKARAGPAAPAAGSR